MSDLSPEEQAAHWHRVQQALDSVDETNALLAERAAERRASGADIEERHQERIRQAEAREQAQQRTPAVLGRNWAAEQKWVEQIIHQTVGKAAIEATGIAISKLRKDILDGVLLPVCEEIGKDFGELDRRLTKRIADLEARIEKSDAATVELLVEMERRLAALEKPATPTKPRLIGGSDAA